MRRTPFPARTSPLSPGTSQLQRTSPILRTVPLKGGLTASVKTVRPDSGQRKTSNSGKLTPPAPGEFSPKTKLLVRKRAGRGDEFEALCEAGGEWLGRDAGEFQHRAARGSGGCRDAVINGPANCCLMCRDCHARAESRDPHMGMDEAGFWIEHGTTPEYDPRNVPIMLASSGGFPAYLAADGLGPDGTGYLLTSPLANQLIAASIAAITEDDAAGLVPSLRTGGTK